MKSRCGIILMVVITILVIALCVAGLFLTVMLFEDELNPLAVFQGGASNRYSDPNAYPWEEGRLFINKQADDYHMGGRRVPFRPQPKLETKLYYEADVYDEELRLGQVTLTVYNDGDASATWTGDFRIGGRNYKAVTDRNGLMSKNIFRGNIAPLKIYQDEDGKDRSKLYVITSGFFHLQGLRGAESVSGAAYITAWIDKDYEAQGKLSIVSFFGGGETIFDWGPVGLSEK